MIDIKKKYCTRDGREVRIYATDGADKYPVHGSIKYETGWELFTWQLDGMRIPGREGGGDLIEVRSRHKRTVWINVYSEEWDWCTADSKEEADRNASDDRIACIKVELNFEEGEGL
jgi:hypothetical protein